MIVSRLVPVRAERRIRAWQTAMLTVLLAATRATAFDWEAASWGIVVATNGTPGSPACVVEYPGGTRTGNVLAVHYALQPTNWPQAWAFLTDGFWRQAPPGQPFLTSYRTFRYFTSDNQDQDRAVAHRIRVVGTNAYGELEIETTWSNNAATADDRFRIDGNFTLEPPDVLHASMRVDLVVSNATGHAVVPWWQGHRDLAEQWVPFSLSSMYVADHLTGGLPSWYDTLDPAHLRVGITNDASLLNDGFSLNGAIDVSTHDTKNIVTPSRNLALNHDTNATPIHFVPGYLWHSQLVLYAETATELRTQHAYRSAWNHHVELLGASGQVSTVSAMPWAATYKRDDANLVDGDNVQVKLGLDAAISNWPAGGVQHISLRLTAGNTPPTLLALAGGPTNMLAIAWQTEPGEVYRVERATSPSGAWTSLLENAQSPATVLPASPLLLYRVRETSSP